jgi:hypothetical protein
MNELIRLIVEPAKTPGRFVGLLLGEVIARSDQPLVDAARVLLARGFDPATPLTMRHQGSVHDSFKPLPIGAWAGWTYTERDKGGVTMAAWMPRAASRGGQKSGSERPADERTH